MIRILSLLEFKIYVAIWIFIQISRIVNQTIPYVNSYLTDLIAIPAMACLFNYFKSLLLKRPYKECQLPLYWLILLTIYVTLICEHIGPKYLNKGTADIADVFCYFIGAISFYILHLDKPKTKKELLV